tara:strand:+ start:86 stop:343 length:258 start_codon:yes stop_codon:yes gene_type:complete
LYLQTSLIYNKIILNLRSGTLNLKNEVKLEKITLYTATQIYGESFRQIGFLDYANLEESLPPEVKVLAMDSEEYTLTKKKEKNNK